MEINESDDAELLQLKLDEGSEDEDFESLNSTEVLLDDLLKRGKDADKEAQNDQADNGNYSKCHPKESVEYELPKSMFQLSDNMKKDLSMLAFPSKPHSRKKGVMSSRVTPNSRITIAEALEKAESARKSMTKLNICSDKPGNAEQDISNLANQCNSSDLVVDKRDRDPQDAMRLSVQGDIPEEAMETVKKLDSSVGGKRVAEDSLPSDAAVSEAASCSEGKTVSVAGKQKSPGTARTQMSPRMRELLKFTFIHEHFPSSVHMARLGKMMGLPWSQVRNWFTDQRVDNKKAGLFPRDRLLIDCPYCNITLETEAEQKSHLFSIQHVKRILGPEYCGGATSESIKWKKLPKTVNAVSKVSGARILAVGFSAEDSKEESPSTSLQEKKTMEAAVEEVPRSEELKKLWTEAMLLPEEKEQPPPHEWNPVRINLEENSENNCKSYKQGKKETVLNLTGQEGKDKISIVNHKENIYEGKVVVNSMVVSIPVSDMNPGVVNDNYRVTISSAAPVKTTNMVAPSTCSVPASTSTVSGVMPEDPRVKKRQKYQDVSVLSDSESPRKVSAFGKKLGMVIESPIESHRSTMTSKSASRKAYRASFPSSVKPKNRHTDYTGSPSNSSHGTKFFKSSSGLASQCMQDIELKQEVESDEMWNCKNNITLYRGDGSDEQGKCEMAVINANKPSFTINQSSASCRPSSPVSPQAIKRSNSVYMSPTRKSGIRSAITKMPRATAEKRQVKFRTHPLGSVLRANKTRSVHEGNIIVGYQCPNCSKVYQTEWLMIKHSVTHFKYHCDICYQVYPTENMMKVHLLDHLSGAYEDEKYYCQFSCKICHSLKCGCCEPTYCKPQDLPRVFFRPQKAKRSKKGFISKLNSGPNDHLKISLSSYKKLIISDSLGLPSKENTEGLTSQKSSPPEDVQKVILVKEAQKSSGVGDRQIPTFVVSEAHLSSTSAELPRLHHKEREEVDSAESNHITLPKDKGSDTDAGVSSDQLEVITGISALKETDLITEKQKQLNWKEIRTKWSFDYKGNVKSLPHSSGLPKPTQGRRGGKRGGRRRQAPKLSSNFIYKDPDTDFYYMCEICDASFSSKSELSEHMFLHRLKSRSRRGEKRGISSVIVEKEASKKVKLHKLEDRADIEAVVGGPKNHSCELCHISFTTAADYNAHKILAHKTPGTADASPHGIEVYRCNYCGKIYRRRGELKRHLKRDCVSAPPSLKGMLSGLSRTPNVIEEAHYTTVKVDFDDKSDPVAKSIGKGAKGPIICKYCLAVTKREAEMKRHIWKFCLKVPAEVVKKFMDGASLEELGFKYINDKVSTVTDISKSTQTEIPGRQNTVTCSSSETPSVNDTNSELDKELGPEKDHPMDGESASVQMEPPDTLNSSKSSLQRLPINETSVQGGTTQVSDSAKHTVEEETEVCLHPVLSDQSLSTVQSEESKKMCAKLEPTEEQKQSSTKPLSEETKMESLGTLEETAQSSASTSPLASPVMQFPIVLPVMTASAKSKKPLVCGYCGIWYFREMAIMKHMKERCIKIPEFEKELLKKNSALCSVPQKAGGSGIASENGAVYKMVKVPEHMQITPVPMPKDVSNEDIKELNINIKAYSENAPAEPAVANEQDNLSSSASLPANQSRTTSGKRGSRCRRCHEHFNSQEAVLAHSSVHHGPKKGFYKCKLCHARLAKYKQLREHVWEHTNENPYRCHLCEVRYRSSDALVEHLLTQHQYTSINDKNLYKWLPGRHGKYRDIKLKNSSCEEKLDDVDTNLESLAEVMVITDKDICSSTATFLKCKANENEVTKSGSEMNENLVDSGNMKERSESLQVDPECSKDNAHENTDADEQKTAHSDSDVIINTDGNAESKGESMADNFLERESVTMEENSEKIPRDSASVKIATVQEESVKNVIVQEESMKNGTVQKESENKGQTVYLNSSKNDSNFKEENEVEAKDAVYVKNAECELDGTFTGEGLLPVVENLDSVVETIQLTDRHLS